VRYGRVFFQDRAEAGRRLGELLARRKLDRPIVYGLPRGGVPVAAEVARRLGAPLDVLVVRKIGAPGQPELALGAIAEGDEAPSVINADVATMSGASQAYLAAASREAKAEIARRLAAYLPGGERPDPRRRTAVIVDDGLATGATARAAAQTLRRRGAAMVVIAAPVAPPDTVADLSDAADKVVTLETPEPFGGVGGFYVDFHQLSDDEVAEHLRQAPAERR
jgi:predicted phosphoribosyltransferase